MKRIVLTLTLIFVVFAISACTRNGGRAAQDNDKINVMTTIFPPYDFTRQIAGDRVNLTMLLPPGAESHSFEPSSRDIINIMQSDIFIYTGGESETWIDRILGSMDTGEMRIIAMMDIVDVVEEEIVEGMEYDDHDDDGHDHDDDETAYDEHIWTSPRNVIRIVQAISGLLCEVDERNAAFYKENAAAYIEELIQLDADINALIAGAKRDTIIFADRFPFRYFTDAYGLSYYAAFPGCSNEVEPSVATIAFLINKIKAEEIPVVFHIELSNERMADMISEGTGAKKLLLHSAHNITKRDFDSGLGYLEIMRGNIKNLQEALY